MALLRDWQTGDDEPCDRYDDRTPESLGPCPACGHDHGPGFCVEDGEFVVCACGVMHEVGFECREAVGHGPVL